MKFIKKNGKLVIAFVTGIVFAGGIAYAASTYNAKDIEYTKEGTADSVTVEKALNELYAIKKDYIKPNGTKKVTEKGEKIDVKNFEFVDTTGMYTESEATGEGRYWVKTIYTCPTDTFNVEFDFGYIPNMVFIYTASHDSASPLIYYSYDSCNTFYQVNVDNNVVTSRIFNKENTKFYRPSDSTGWQGVTFDIYAIK